MRRASSAERNTDGHRLQCLARALVRVALFVIALRKRLALVDGDAARDYPPLIGNELRDPIADEALAGLGLSGHPIAASSGLGLIMLVAIPVGLAGLLPYERFRRRVLGSPHHGASLTPATSKMISSSTGVPSGRLAAPYTKRQGLLSFPTRLAATPKRRQRLSADRGHLPKWPSIR